MYFHNGASTNFIVIWMKWNNNQVTYECRAEYEMSKLLKQTYSSFMTNGISLQRSKIHNNDKRKVL